MHCKLGTYNVYVNYKKQKVVYSTIIVWASRKTTKIHFVYFYIPRGCMFYCIFIFFCNCYTTKNIPSVILVVRDSLICYYYFLCNKTRDHERIRFYWCGGCVYIFYYLLWKNIVLYCQQ